MKVTKTLRPGADGTKRYQRIYGDRLVCVRNRRDVPRGKRMVTVELIVSETLLEDSWPDTELADPIHRNALVQVRIEYRERELRTRARAAGATWNRHRRLWEMRYGDALDLGLRHRVLDDPDLVT